MSAAGRGSDRPVLGIYGAPTALWELGVAPGELGVNAIFAHSASLTDDVLARCAA